MIIGIPFSKYSKLNNKQSARLTDADVSRLKYLFREKAMLHFGSLRRKPFCHAHINFLKTRFPVSLS
jgi:hypothetical protein